MSGFISRNGGNDIGNVRERIARLEDRVAAVERTTNATEQELYRIRQAIEQVSTSLNSLRSVLEERERWIVRIWITAVTVGGLAAAATSAVSGVFGFGG